MVEFLFNHIYMQNIVIHILITYYLAWSKIGLELITKLLEQKVLMYLWANGNAILNNLPNKTRNFRTC
jgi:hypothetical protein